jgi:hypothetical protein
MKQHVFERQFCGGRSVKPKREGLFTGTQLDRIEDGLAVLSAGILKKAQLADEMRGFITARALERESNEATYFMDWLIRIQATESLDSLFPRAEGGLPQEASDE